ncbi:GPI-anchored surface protein, putative [Bodo saltans]|uniref:GPI-anchored surface protein, putative n=1 Tax=Bodo saltans TaxID=75058 RepID=A0A0S4JW36_BODSA|nr:GPI-anchored surface protein, putative [Bodo saltans]|eukprot:CUG92777.1 GPI-anchored surface protein, putative [Bodo saltans]
MHTFTRTISPVVDEEDSMTGVVCDNLNPHLIIYIAASLVTLVLILYCRHRSVSPPSFVLGKSTPDFGLPFKFAAVMYNVCLWALVPQITLFLVFHVLTTDVFPLQTNCACIVITTVPFMPFVLLVQGTLMLALLPRPNSIRTDVCDVLFPESMTSSTASSSEPLFSTAVVVGVEVKPSKQNKKLEKTLILAAIMYNVCLWSLVPQITLFLVFHVLTTDVFPLQTNCACIVITTVPFMPFVLLVQGTLMLALLPRPNSIRTDVCDVLFPESMTASTASSSEPSFSTAVFVGVEVKPSKQNKKLEKTLILGCTSHGALLVDALCKEQRAGDVEGYMVDLSGSDSQSAFVHYNADCLGVSDALGARYFRASADNCVLPFADGFFDRVVISPGLRSSDSIGNVLTPENEKLPRMLCVLCEGMRVLRVGGEMCALDDIFTVLRLWADLRDAGFAASITDALAVSQPVLKWKVYHLKAFRPASPSLGCNSSASSKSTVGGDREANRRKPGQGLPSPFSPSLSLDEEMLLSHHKETQPNQTISTPATPLFGDTCKAAPTTGVVPTYAQHLDVILGIQSTVFVLLVVGMVAKKKLPSL